MSELTAANFRKVVAELRAQNTPCFSDADYEVVACNDVADFLFTYWEFPSWLKYLD